MECIQLEEVMKSAKFLSVSDKVSLIRQISMLIEKELKSIRTKPRKSLRGLWKGLNISDEDIDEIRHEMWNMFPREDTL